MKIGKTTLLHSEDTNKVKEHTDSYETIERYEIIHGIRYDFQPSASFVHQVLVTQLIIALQHYMPYERNRCCRAYGCSLRRTYGATRYRFYPERKLAYREKPTNRRRTRSSC